MNLTFRDKLYTERTASPPTGDYVVVLHKWMVDFGMNVFRADNIPMSTNGVPAVGQFVQPSQGYTPVIVNKAMADWWIKIQAEQFPSNNLEVTKALLNLTYWKKAFNNKVGWGMEDYPRNEYFSGDRKGQGYKEDMGLLWCYSEGSVYKKKGEGRVAGKDCVVIEALDAKRPETWPTTYVGNEHLFTVATNAFRNTNAPHGYQVDPFPPFPVDSTVRHILVPLFVNNDNKLFIEKKYTKSVTGSYIPVRPYGIR